MADSPEDEWKKVQAGWDARREAAGAIPPSDKPRATLPSEATKISNPTDFNSTPHTAPIEFEAKPDDPITDGLRAMQELARRQADDQAALRKAIEPLAEGARQAARLRFEQEAREGAARSSVAPGKEPPAEKTTVAEGSKTSDHERHPTTKTLDYLGLGVILAPAPEVIAMYLRHEDIDWQRVAISFVASILAGSAILWFAHGWRKPAGVLAALRGRINSADDYFAVRAALIAFFMIAPVLIAPLISGTAPVPPPTSFVNPLYEDAVKWRIAEGIRRATIAGNLSAQCHVTVITVQEQQAQDYAADFKKILEVINWKYDERFATAPIPRGISIRGVSEQIQSRACAVTLAAQLITYPRTRSGASLKPDILRWTSSPDAPDYLRECPQGLCIEASFGNDDSQ